MDNVDIEKKKNECWDGLRRALVEAYPDDQSMPDRVCMTEDGVYRYVSQILCANQNRAKRIQKLSDALMDSVEELRRLSERASDAADDAEESIGDSLIGNVL